MNDIDWIFELKNKAPIFLDKLKGTERHGYFSYSLSGDRYDQKTNWGLGNTVFATKCYYSLGLIDQIPNQQKYEMSQFIKSFQKKNGEFFDPLVKKRSFLREKLVAVKNLDLNNFFHQLTTRAETRQAISALYLLSQNPDLTYHQIPTNTTEIESYLTKLNWQRPWGAGSHFSHLIFFLKHSELSNKEDLINAAIDWVNKIQSPDSGSWFKGNPTEQQKVNGAMKVLTGLAVAQKLNFKYPEKLIDLCLTTENNRHACDNFNIVYVLYQAKMMTNNQYRPTEIKSVAQKRLKSYQDYYHPSVGGFSFSPNKSNVYYYDAKITKGLAEPDIHGTCLFLWGISFLADILEINNQLGFKQYDP